MSFDRTRVLTSATNRASPGQGLQPQCRGSHVRRDARLPAMTQETVRRSPVWGQSRDPTLCAWFRGIRGLDQCGTLGSGVPAGLVFFAWRAPTLSFTIVSGGLRPLIPDARALRPSSGSADCSRHKSVGNLSMVFDSGTVHRGAGLIHVAESEIGSRSQLDCR